MTAIRYDRVGSHGEVVPSCANSPGLDVYRAEIERRFGFTWLGDCAIRSTASGSWSVHAVRRAVDFGYPASDYHRAALYLTWLTENGGARARILGVQALHDYAIGSDGSYGTNRPLKRLWGHGQAVWRFGNVGSGWFWTHTELLIEVASSADEIRRRFEELAAYDSTPTPPPLPPVDPGPPITPKAGDMQGITSTRLLDTRGGTPPSAGRTHVVPTAGRVPAGTKSVFITAAALDPTTDGFMTAWAEGVRPDSSFANLTRGVASSNATIVRLDSQGQFRIYVQPGSHLIVDAAGVSAS